MAVVIPAVTFLHIPKCGGTWAMKAMAAAGIPLHGVPDGYYHHIAATDAPFVFTFVRHPLTWYQSFWKHRWTMAEQLGGDIAEHLRQDAERCHEEIDKCLVDESGCPRDFAGFVEQCVVDYPGFLSEKFALYTAKAHFVGRQESLCEDLLEALARAGLNVSADVIRSTPMARVGDSKWRAEYAPGFDEWLLAAESAAVERFYGSALVQPILAMPSRTISSAA